VEDSNVVEDNVELVGTLAERFTDERGDMGTLGEELVGVELRIDGLELLCAGGGKDLRVILGAEEWRTRQSSAPMRSEKRQSLPVLGPTAQARSSRSTVVR
jgi:hypothetical protein